MECHRFCQFLCCPVEMLYKKLDPSSNFTIPQTQCQVGIPNKPKHITRRRYRGPEVVLEVGWDHKSDALS